MGDKYLIVELLQSRHFYTMLLMKAAIQFMLYMQKVYEFNDPLISNAIIAVSLIGPELIGWLCKLLKKDNKYFLYVSYFFEVMTFAVLIFYIFSMYIKVLQDAVRGTM